MTGPLHGLKIIEMAGLGPGPFAAMMLADHGAEVIRVERPGNLSVPNDPLTRSRRSLAVNLKTEDGVAIVRRLAKTADGLMEGYRPGVMERLGLGPDLLLGDNPKLVYGRVTGWGQEGPLAQAAGHDLNYLALTGLLVGLGPKDGPPMAPANYLADFAGGGMMLAFGMVAALLAVQRGGEGQVIDAAMTDGAALIGALTYGMCAAGMWADEREANLLDGGDPLYGCYRCADGKYLAWAPSNRGSAIRRQRTGADGIPRHCHKGCPQNRATVGGSFAGMTPASPRPSLGEARALTTAPRTFVGPTGVPAGPAPSLALPAIRPSRARRRADNEPSAISVSPLIPASASLLSLNPRYEHMTDQRLRTH